MNLIRQVVLTCSTHVTRLFACSQQASLPSWCPEFVKYNMSILYVCVQVQIQQSSHNIEVWKTPVASQHKMKPS